MAYTLYLARSAMLMTRYVRLSVEPGYWLGNITLTQTHADGVESGRILLGVGPDGELQGVGATVREIIQGANVRGANISTGLILPGNNVKPPAQELSGVTPWEALRALLAWVLAQAACGALGALVAVLPGGHASGNPNSFRARVSHGFEGYCSSPRSARVLAS